MTLEQIQLVKMSFAKVEPIAETTADLFYSRLFEIAPSVKPLFKTERSVQGRKLMASLAFVVKNLERPDVLLPAVEKLGRKHIEYGTKDEHYEFVGQALLWTLEQGLGDGFAKPVKEAWEEAYGLLASVMIEAAAETEDRAA